MWYLANILPIKLEGALITKDIHWNRYGIKLILIDLSVMMMLDYDVYMLKQKLMKKKKPE